MPAGLWDTACPISGGCFTTVAKQPPRAARGEAWVASHAPADNQRPAGKAALGGRTRKGEDERKAEWGSNGEEGRSGPGEVWAWPLFWAWSVFPCQRASDWAGAGPSRLMVVLWGLPHGNVLLSQGDLQQPKIPCSIQQKLSRCCCTVARFS